MGVRENHGDSDRIEGEASSQFHSDVASAHHHGFTAHFVVGLNGLHQIVGLVDFSQVVDASRVSSRRFEVGKVYELQVTARSERTFRDCKGIPMCRSMHKLLCREGFDVLLEDYDIKPTRSLLFWWCTIREFNINVYLSSETSEKNFFRCVICN